MRLGPLDPATLDPHQKAVYETVAGGPRKGVRGPIAVWLRRAALAEPAQALGRYCRYETCLPPRLSELAILLTGRHWRAAYEWAAHAPVAIAAGLDQAVVEAIRVGATPCFERDDEALVHAFVTTLYAAGRIDDALYARAVGTLGEDGVVDLTGLLGYYALISMTINVFDIPAAGGAAGVDPFGPAAPAS
ncbi:carboxymuconolactone decarboxylase family protein [Rhodoplanes sp. TEM]|uniref:Carboxymuconolactone decarboxylase family protein n=1 Tax=Rhodoplanes tepidamans TaxID=200616 RepID=A0ABT5JDP4_RHOTP|nr:MULTISPECIES: carboxymuconolactone decarboxylase family protein [Rhodoplanes]MDC7787190.1 carboxymuconolactone decarboxylase family protein [Rhodoplanes tepidamans]MDC7984246.1 carboxymuconolactone decarboxylase family protein [Rhodoplanes sp. TEM]MDQ0356043.1 4-carboxymuconolactone decarboxylase [Rhodoplanes tepidamans]